MSEARTNGVNIIAIGFPPSDNANNYMDVRIIRGSTWPSGNVTWSAMNDFGSFTVGFRPHGWIPYEDPDPAPPRAINRVMREHAEYRAKNPRPSAFGLSHRGKDE